MHSVQVFKLFPGHLLQFLTSQGEHLLKLGTTANPVEHGGGIHFPFSKRKPLRQSVQVIPPEHFLQLLTGHGRHTLAGLEKVVSGQLGIQSPLYNL